MTSDGNVLAYTGTGTSLSIDTMTVSTLALLAALPGVPRLCNPPSRISRVRRSRSAGPGIDRFWQITGVAVGATTTVLTLKSPGLPAEEWGLPDTTSEFKVTHLSPNFFVSETDTLDSLTVFNDGSTTNDVGALSATSVTGLGMSPAGINYANMESVEVLLGTGDDTFTVTGTAAGAITAVHGGGGTDHLYVTGGGGAGAPLLVYGDTTQDGSRYSSDGKESTAGFYNADNVTPRPSAAFAFANDGGDTIDASVATQTVAIYGGGGNDVIYGSQAGDHLAGGAGGDEIHGQGGADHIYGDSGFNQDLATRLDRVIGQPSSDPPGGDQRSRATTSFGDAGDDIIFGDHGIIPRLRAHSESSPLNVVRVETTKPPTAATMRSGRADNDVSLGAPATTASTATKDRPDPRRPRRATSRAAGDMTSAVSALCYAQLYTAAGNAQVTPTWQWAPGSLPAWSNGLITHRRLRRPYHLPARGQRHHLRQPATTPFRRRPIRLDVGTLANPKASSRISTTSTPARACRSW